LLFQGLVLALLAFGAGADEQARVRAVTDGDSLILEDGRDVRMLGINAPELGHHERPVEPLGAAAQQRLAQLLEGRTVRLRFGAERYDRYRRTLAHVELPDGTAVEEVLVREGLAFAIAIPPNLDRVDVLFAADATARLARRGIWAHPYFRARAATELQPSDTGFRRVSGTVSGIGRGKKYLYLDLAPEFALMIPRAEAHRFGAIDRWRNRTVVARGWVFSRGGSKLGMRLAHPLMLETSPR
jgi:endonuclease YncB( thermonuclease family)